MSILRTLDGYAVDKCIHASPLSDVHAAVRESDGRRVVVKRYLQDINLDGESRAQRERDVLRQVAGSGVPEAIELIRFEEIPVLVLEHVAGSSLASWIESGLPPPEHFLEVAIQLADLLARIHDTRLLHLDVSPHNVFVDSSDRRTSLIGFGAARPLGSATHAVRSEGQHSAEKLRYASPEHTGRMDRGVDSRSDLYSLGAMFYFALTGGPPFPLDDPLALIHAHMAKAPVPPLELRATLPPTLSRIVTKLLQKSPEARYQTARALHRDLIECQTQLAAKGFIDNDFPLGTADAPYRPLFSKKLYGRENEVRALLDCYQVACDARTTVLFMKGPPGMGKSALVHELRTPLVTSGGYLASGKFDLYKRDVPYFGFVQAFESFTQQILAESDVQLERWRTELTEALGPSAGVLVELIPDLRIVLGDLPRAPALGPAQTRARLALAVQRFVQALAAKDHPLVLFLDDLQWADEGSRDLTLNLLTSVSDCALLLLGSYRDTEIGAGHPLMRLIAELQLREVPIRELELSPLADDACARMLAEALGRRPEETLVLAACVGRKTGNTPLLIQQFVYHMYDLQLIRFQLPGGWTWDDAAITAADIPEDAVALMTAKIGRLSRSVASVLQLASCVGDSFELETLAELTDQPSSVLEQALFTLCDEGLIAPARSGFRFVHDRIREGAQAGLSTGERTHVHHQAARLLLQRTSPEALASRAVEIADHLNFAHEHLDEDERLRAIELNVRAGKAALRAGAAVTAARYFDAGRAVFRDGHWAEHPQLGFDLFLQAAETAYQLQDPDLALNLLSLLESAGTWSRIQSAQIAANQVLAWTRRNSGPQELAFVLETVRRFGVRWPQRPSLLRIRFEVLRTDWALRGSLGQDRFRLLAASGYGDWIAPLLVLRAASPALARNSTRLACLSTGFSLRILMRHGFVTTPAYVVAAWASTRLGCLRHLRRAERYAQAALDWNLRETDPTVRARTELILHGGVYAWTRARRTVFDAMRKAEELSREAGDLDNAYMAGAQRLHLAALAGEPLARIVPEYAALAQRLARWRVWSNVQPRVFKLLQQPLPEPAELMREIAEIEALYQSTESASRANQYVFWLVVLCLLGCERQAFEASERMATWIYESGAASPQVADFTFFRGVLAAQRAMRTRGAMRRAHLRVLHRARRRVRTWAQLGPDFRHMAQALETERVRVRGKDAAALRGYTQAIQRASEQGYVHHAAFLHERRASLLTELRRGTEAATALRQAIALYEEWGALGKSHALRQLASEL